VESKYLNKFAKLREAGDRLSTLVGDRITVEVLPKEELKSAGGIVIASDISNVRSSTEENRPTLAIVLEVGAGVFDENGEDVPSLVEPGNIILVSAAGLKLYSQYPGLLDYTANTIAMTRESEIHRIWPSIEAFQEYKALLNS
jgi:co-chaperonin GroES (HSP10)